jgi:hypothetical protein
MIILKVRELLRSKCAYAIVKGDSIVHRYYTENRVPELLTINNA